MKELKSVNRFPEGLGFSLFLTVFGGCFILGGLFFGGVFREGWRAFWEMQFPLQLFVGLGIMLSSSGLMQARVYSRFGKPTPTVSVAAVIPGEEFEFRYTLPVHRDTEIESIRVFLVLRERVSFFDVDERTTIDIDRLYQMQEQPGKRYRKRESIEIQQSFCVPEGDRGVRNPYMSRKDATLTRMWVVKVHLHPADAVEVWGEYDLEVPFVDQAASLPEPDLFEVVLEDVPLIKILNTTSILRSLLPHLRAGQIGDLCRNGPNLLLENVPLKEAQQAQMLLEAAGAKAIICASQIVRKVGDPVEIGP